MTGSPDIRPPWRASRSREASAAVRLSELLPSVSGNTSDRIQRRDEQSTNLVTRSETYNLSLDMSWQIDLFGKQLQNLKASTKDVEQTIENFYAAQVTLASDAGLGLCHPPRRAGPAGGRPAKCRDTQRNPRR